MGGGFGVVGGGIIAPILLIYMEQGGGGGGLGWGEVGGWFRGGGPEDNMRTNITSRKSKRSHPLWSVRTKS